MPSGIYERTAYHRRRLSESHRGVVHKDKQDAQVRIERQRQSRIRWNKDNAEVVRAAGRKWERNHPSEVIAKNMRRQAHKLQATPPWLTKEHFAEILQFYVRARELGLVVDHAVPLRAKNVSGLHVPWNLQLMSRASNLKKGNKLCL